MYKLPNRTAICLGTLLMLASMGTRAATIPYAVDDYIPVLFKDVQLVVGGSLDFNGNGTDYKNDSAGGSFYVTEKNEYQGDNFNIAGRTYYARQYTTVAKWYDYYAQVNADIRMRKNTYNSSNTSTSSSTYEYEREDKTTNINPSIYQRVDLGKYLSGDIMVSAIASMNYNYNKTSKGEGSEFTKRVDIAGTTATRSTDTEESEYPRDNKYLEFRGELLLGNGRIYDGVFAFTSISMIEELDRKGLLLKTPTADEMEALTEIIYQNRLLHSIDFRIREIEIYEEINSFLNSKGIVELSNPMTTPVIRDVWEYFPTDPHEFGWMIRGGFGLMRHYNSDQSTNKSTSRELEETYDTGNPAVVTVVSDDTFDDHNSNYSKTVGTFPYFTVIVEKKKPLSNRLQLDLMAQGSVYFSARDTSIYENRYYDGDSLIDSYTSNSSVEYESATSFGLSGQLNYVFDYRTSANVSAYYNRFDYDQTLIYSQQSLGGSASGDTLSTDVGGYSLGLNASVMYRISIPTTFRAYVSYNKYNGSMFSASSGEYSNDSYNFRLSIDHQIF